MSSVRHIVLDTETTGLSPQNGDRILEIGCVEMVNRRITGNNLHLYINPERHVGDEVIAVHGITNEFLADKPIFSAVAKEFMDFIDGAELVIHNAAFDIGFLDNELMLLGDGRWQRIGNHCKVIDTLTMARKRHPGQRNSLDALCKRYDIDNSHRQLHGALLDAEILASVYLAMTGGQLTMSLADDVVTSGANQTGSAAAAAKQFRLRRVMATADEMDAHQQYMDTLGG